MVSVHVSLARRGTCREEEEEYDSTAVAAVGSKDEDDGEDADNMETRAAACSNVRRRFAMNSASVPLDSAAEYLRFVPASCRRSGRRVRPLARGRP